MIDINEIDFVELPPSSYAAFKWSSVGDVKDLVDKDTRQFKYTGNDPEVWKYDPDKAIDCCYLAKLDKQGKFISDTFCWEERLNTGPDRKKIFRWVIVGGIKYYMTEEIPPQLHGQMYRFKYKLVPVEEFLRKLEHEANQTNQQLL